MVDLSGGIYGSTGLGFDNFVFVVPGIIVIGLAVFFMYKLFKVLTERETKREEKKKMKQMKKKK